MTCGSCATDNTESRRFCRSCGATLGVACARCAFRNDAADRYCGGCGAETGVSRLTVPRAAETAAAVLSSAMAPELRTKRWANDASRPAPPRSTVAPAGGGTTPPSVLEIATLLDAGRGDDVTVPPPELTQAELDRLFGRN